MSKKLDNILEKIQKEFKIEIIPATEACKKNRTTLDSPGLNFNLGGGWVNGACYYFQGPESGGKENSYSTRILTPTGWTTMGEIKEGDVVITPYNTLSTVLNKFEKGEKDIYKVILEDGSASFAGLEHNWSVMIPDEITKEKTETQVKTTEEIIDLMNRGAEVYLPMVQPIDFRKEESLPIDPYIFGILLNKGVSLSPVIRILVGKMDRAIINDLIAYCEERNFKYNISDVSSRTQILFDIDKNSGIQDDLVSLGLGKMDSWSKSIPEIYANSSIENRIKFLRGLLDAGGEIVDNEIRCRVNSYYFAKGIQYIVRSLGGKATLLVSPHTVRNEFVIAIPMTGELKENLFSLERKTALFKVNSNEYTSFNKITSVALSHKEQAACIFIDDPHHEYVIDDFTVTHNTTLATYIASQVQKKYKEKPVVVYCDFEYAFDADHAAQLGLDVSPDKFILLRPMTGEDGFQMMIQLVDSGEVGLVVIDSITTMATRAQKEDAFKSTYGAQAKILSEGLRNLNPHLNAQKCSLIMVSQERQNIGVLYGPDYKGTGGKAPLFYASWAARVTRTGDIENSNKELIGIEMRVKNTKNKLSIPKRTSNLKLYFDSGINSEEEYMDYLVNLEIVKKVGAMYSNEEWGMRVRGIEAVKKFLSERPALYEQVKRDINTLITGFTIIDEKGDVDEISEDDKMKEEEMEELGENEELEDDELNI